ncbi:molybdenum cofactor biosynthesis protein MoaE [Paenibacillus lemnae]|uniref:Molybdopterin converting factor n=1 Tax=Paenibacillus lemnae TaxID=1330551 RepID=A0A848M411_PAELE|nr:molybdenum cofactor biosynthesis protein MoaE [Paenibacillus lemnae]NMO95525.1 molybdopterin converting factor [Paenibacillus lemnae]
MKSNIQILLFAGLAEKIGHQALDFPVEQFPLTAKELKDLLSAAYPEASSLIQISFAAVNHTYAADDQQIQSGDEVALIPPVSGGDGLEPSDAAEPVHHVSADGMCVISALPLSSDDTLVKVLHPNHGASLSFVGTTREITGDMKTVTLEYEAYIPMALAEMQKIITQMYKLWPGTSCAISHRVGIVDIGEISVVIAVSAPHRDTCYTASRYAIEELKRSVPIWKKEVWADGSQWKGYQTGPWDPLPKSE